MNKLNSNLNLFYFKILKRLADEIASPMIQSSRDKIKCEFNESKELSFIKKQKRELIRPTEDEKLLQPVQKAKVISPKKK
jgi:hypothetical protein